MNSAVNRSNQENLTRETKSLIWDGAAKSGKTAPLGASVGAGRLTQARNDG